MADCAAGIRVLDHSRVCSIQGAWVESVEWVEHDSGMCGSRAPGSFYIVQVTIHDIEAKGLHKEKYSFEIKVQSHIKAFILTRF
jgi:hypothetical protein